MRKLSLDLGTLKVESFDTFVPAEKRGTVHANSPCPTYSCPPGTCGASPPYTSTLTTEDLWARTATNCPQCCV
jgi:hypothetical protein